MIDKLACFLVATIVLTIIYLAIYGLSILVDLPHDWIATVIFGGYVWSRIYLYARGIK